MHEPEMDIWFGSVKYPGCHLSQWLSCSKSSLVHDHDLYVGVLQILIYHIVYHKPLAKKQDKFTTCFISAVKQDSS